MTCHGIPMQMRQASYCLAHAEGAAADRVELCKLAWVMAFVEESEGDRLSLLC